MEIDTRAPLKLTTLLVCLASIIFFFFLIGGYLLSSVALVAAIHQHESAIHVFSLLSLPPTSHPIPPLWVITEHQAELPALFSNFPLAICFTHGNVYISMLLSQFTPPSLSSIVSINLSLFLPCK